MSWWLSLPFETRLIVVLLFISIFSCFAGFIAGRWWERDNEGS